MIDVRDDVGRFQGYAKWYAAAAGSLFPLSALPIVEAAEVESGAVSRQEWSLLDLTGGLAELGVLLLNGLFVLLVATSARPAPRSGRRIVGIAMIAAVSAVLVVTTPTTDEPLTGWGKAAAAMLILTAVLAADHAFHLVRYRRRLREQSER
jgi:uncharacterized membrane protein